MSFTQATSADIVFHFKPGCNPPIELEILNPKMVGLRPASISPFVIDMQRAQSWPAPEPCTTIIHDPPQYDSDLYRTPLQSPAEACPPLGDTPRPAKRARTDDRDHNHDEWPFTPYLYKAIDKAPVIPVSAPEPPMQTRILAKWTNALTNDPKWICYEAYPDKTNSIEIKLMPHSEHKGILTVVIQNQIYNKVVVRNNTYNCAERTYTTRKNAVTFHYVLSYCEEHLIEAIHLTFTGRKVVNKFRLIPSNTHIGWNISTPVVA